jgi:hypothetical protein
MSTDNDNVIPIGRKSGDENSGDRKNEVLCMIDNARGVIELASRVLMEEERQTDAACALVLANQELQRVRDLYAEIVGI